MSHYTPDVWVVLELDGPKTSKPIRKVFAGWYGGYAGSNTWKLNSGITVVRYDGTGNYEFDGHSGSTYFCHANNYHMSALMQGVLSNWVKNAGLEGNTRIRILKLDEITEA